MYSDALIVNTSSNNVNVEIDFKIHPTGLVQ